MKFNLHAYEIYKKAEEAFRLGDVEKAIELSLKSLKYGDDALTYNLLGQIYEKIGNISNAIKYYEKEEEGQKDLRYPRSLTLKRAKIKKEYEKILNKEDLDSLVVLEKMYCRQDLQWHWAELKDFADKLRKCGDYQCALTWINAAINSKMIQMSKESSTVKYDSSLASLYTLKGIIYIEIRDYLSALREFVIATMHYEWKATEVLTTKINLALRKSNISEDMFNNVIEITKTNGLTKGLSSLDEIFMK